MVYMEECSKIPQKYPFHDIKTFTSVIFPSGHFLTRRANNCETFWGFFIKFFYNLHF